MRKLILNFANSFPIAIFGWNFNLKHLKRVIVSVINDLVTDQRVHKVCLTLHEMGFDVLLVGRKKKNSMALTEREYPTKRMRLVFEKGPLFYAEYNIRLFILLLLSKVDVIVSNDLDTLLSSYVVSKVRNKNLVYDTHEFFTGVPELSERHIVKKIWKMIEAYVFPRLDIIYTVNSSLAVLYYKLYRKMPRVVRNVPFRRKRGQAAFRPDYLPKGAKVVLYQGAVNVDRGLEEAIEAMKYLKCNAVLLILGGGDIYSDLREVVSINGLQEKVFLPGPVPFEELSAYTEIADVGLSIEKDTNINYRYSLPNKLFDYIQAEVPVLVSRLPEMESLLMQNDIGILLDFHDPKDIAQKLDEMLTNSQEYAQWKQNLKQLAADFCWENEQQLVQKIYEPYV